jgi:transcriptional regulatory protein LEU3
VRNIKEAVVASGPSSTISPTVAPPLRPSQLQSPTVRELPYISTGGTPPTYSTPPTTNPSFGRRPMSVDPQSESSGLSSVTTRPRAAGQVAEPRALASNVFSGADIDYYFDK